MEFIDFLIEEAFISFTLISLIVLFVSNLVMDFYKKYDDIDTNEAINLMDKNIIILDVRENKERKNGHIKNDKHIPMAQIKNKLSELDKNQTTLVYCHSGSRSSHICRILTKANFLSIYNLQGGFKAWSKANLPISIT